MSSEKHANLGLHKWASTDGVLRTEFNDNFGKIDAKVAGIGDVTLIPQATVVDALKNTTAELEIRGVNVKEERFGAKGDWDGTNGTDDTAAIQSAIDYAYANKISEVLIPDGVYLIDCLVNVFVKSNITLKLSPNAQLKAKTNNVDRYYMLNIENATNVKVIGGTLTGERDTHQGTVGEWGYGIRVSGSTHVEISDIKIEKFWGDGIALVSYNGTPCEYVTIRNIVSDSNRRQGISLIRCKNTKVLDSVFSNTNGAAPEAGIDIEPDPTMADSENITVKGCTLFGNKGSGIMVTFNVINSKISENNCFGNKDGIYVVGDVADAARQPKGIDISDNICNNNLRNGIRIEYVKNTNVLNNIVKNNLDRGLNVYTLENGKIERNHVEGNTLTGIYVQLNSKNVHVLRNVLKGNGGSAGLLVNQSTTNCTVSNNQIEGTNTYAILVNDATVAGVNITDNDLSLFTGTTKILNNGINCLVSDSKTKGGLVTAIPTTGTWEKGQILYNSAPTAGGKLGWVCITAGSPGTWKGFGAIDA
ncbi:right-handed parallel beta-helix repeat-containing protein [Peribacillus butanolivorans]|uniref:right-handed parallel beta-helix repeat-containing protein n=1 Tax=Peribacillus butanolivorans TaxID=421767 RepID=UPI00207C6216|nr:right-handed parallel beta-helix repeat-containing protein [Peribacillus butanolivorans]MCO0597361.1 right-handed parallel beta-helix repeat-containing protein [Peribacillus butanolivorans]